MGRKVEVAEGSGVEVPVGVGVGVRVGVRLGQGVSVEWMVGPAGVLVSVREGPAVRVGGSSVSVEGRVAAGKGTFVAEAVALTVMAGRLTAGFLIS